LKPERWGSLLFQEKYQAEKAVTRDDNTNNINNNNNNKWTLRTKVIPVTTGATGTIQKIPEQHTGKAQNQGTAANSHIGHCTRISRRTNVKVRNIQNEKLHVP